MKRIILTAGALFMIFWLSQEVGAQETKANYSASWTEKGRAGTSLDDKDLHALHMLQRGLSAQGERQELTPAHAAAKVVEKADAMIHVLSYFTPFR